MFILVFLIFIYFILLYYILINKNLFLYFTHYIILEILWTIIPAILLLLISIPSLKLLYNLEEILDPQITIKVEGHQWYWSYELSDYYISSSYDSYMIKTEDLIIGQFRLLEVDKLLQIPINTQIRLVVTSQDVIHSFAVPSLSLKIDAVPGRLNQIHFSINRLGIFYGQCSEICGSEHSFMPIVISSKSLNSYISQLDHFII